jgi:hypothetical protein
MISLSLFAIGMLLIGYVAGRAHEICLQHWEVE